MNRPNYSKQNKHSNKNTPPPVNSRDAETNSDIEELENSRQTAQQTNSEPSINKWIIAFIANKEKQPLIANWLSLGMVIITAILAIYTYKLFNTSSDAVRKAEIADSTAIEALNTSKKQFIIINQPYLEMVDVSFNGAHNGKANIGFRIRNLNNVVVNAFKQCDTIIWRDDKARIITFMANFFF
jgi:hypothetical protein